MESLLPPFTHSDFISLFGIFTAALIGIFSIFYSRLTYFFSVSTTTLKADIKFQEVKEYYNEFINVPPSKKVNLFLKKNATTRINGGIDLPLEITDCLIKNYASNYFHLIIKLKRTWREFEVVNDLIVCRSSGRQIFMKGVIWFLLYLVFGVLTSFLIDNFNWFLHRQNNAETMNVALNLVLILVVLISASLFSLASILNLIAINEINNILKKVELPSSDNR